MRTSLIVMATALAGPVVTLDVAAEPAPRSLDQAMVQTLALGQANGCGPAFGVPDFNFDQTALDTFLAAERDAGRLSKELAAICGSSAVASAASLGGSLGSAQTTKTVSQFRAVRSRSDSRLTTRDKRSALDGQVLLAQAGGGNVGPMELGFGSGEADGLQAYVQLDHEVRTRSTTPLETGYRARTTEATLGLDTAVAGQWVLGGWLGWRGTSADYRTPGLLIGGSDNGFGNSLDGATRAAICRTQPGGGFDDEGARIGVYAARRFGDGFADLGAQYSRRHYRYDRSVCAIEANPGALAADPGSPSGYTSDGIAIDDVYGGIISGKARLTEWALSARAGIDFGQDRFSWGPRLGLTYTRTRIGAYTETGRTSVTHTVRSNTGLLETLRSPGDPIGLELAFGDRSRSSLQSELQLVTALRQDTPMGALTPRLALSWLHEFRGERQAVPVRMAGDRRATPTVFEFTTDAQDPDRGLLALGVTWQGSAGFTADVELRHQFGDNRFDVTSLGLRALWRF